jgi:hypothetical protein
MSLFFRSLLVVLGLLWGSGAAGRGGAYAGADLNVEKFVRPIKSNGQLYSVIIPIPNNLSGRVERAYLKAKELLEKDKTQGGLDEGDIRYLTNEDGSFILDENGNKIGELTVDIDGSPENVTVLQNDNEAGLRGMVSGGNVVELTQTAKNHLKYGEIKISLKNSLTGEPISTTVRKPIDPPILVPNSGVNVSVDVSGIHFENALQIGLIEEIYNSKALVTTLFSGEKVYKSKIKVFIQEINNGQGGWKTVANEKTWWPSSWSEQKVWEKISEAFNNKVIDKGSRWHGTTSDGTKIEMYIDVNGNISTAYIIP